MIRRLGLLLMVLALAASSAAAAPSARSKPGTLGAPGSLTDFSGLWELDPKESSGGAPNLEKAVLEVTQKGDRIWIQPLGDSRRALLAEEIVVDGRAYQKALGKNKGTVTAKWGTDGKSLWLEIVAGTDEAPRAAMQRSVWKLSEDRKTWVRETVTMAGGAPRRSRLVFQRHAPTTPTPKPAASR